MSNQIKILIISIFSWIVSIKMFLLISFRIEFWNIWKYSENIFDFYENVFIFMFDFVDLISPMTAILSTLFVVLLLYFYYTYFWISYNKLDAKMKIKNKKHAIFGGIFTFLGFGCVACGQTLLYSFLLLLGSSVSTILAPVIGQASLLVGIVFLAVGIFKNLQLKNSPNICKI